MSHTRIGEYHKINSSYLNDLMNYIPISNDIEPDFKIGLDFGGGAACNYVNRLCQFTK